MKKLLSLFLLSSLVLAACQTTETPLVEDGETTDFTEYEGELENEGEASLKDKIENLSNYSLITDAQVKSFVPACDAYSEAFAKKVKEGEVKTITLYSSESYSLALLSTPNYDNWTEADFDKVNKCVDGVGVKTVQKIVSDRLLWAYPSCSAGVKPNTDDSEYNDFEQCIEVEKELVEYLNS